MLKFNLFKKSGPVFFVLPFILLSLFFACHKSTVSKDVFESDEAVFKDVKGIVYNICTDSGMAGIPVFLNVFRNTQKIKTLQTISGSDGTYEFKNAELHTSKDYNYNIFIASRSGTVPKDSITCGFEGTSISFSLEESDVFMKPRVIPCFITMEFNFLRDKASVDSDSILVRVAQNTYHKNRPDYPYQFGSGSVGSRKEGGTGVNSYPMGKYNMVIDKWVGGVHTQTRDSIYLKYATSSTYVVRW